MLDIPLAERTVLGCWRAARGLGEHRTFLVSHERTWSHTEAGEAVDKLAAALASRGIGPGDRVALLHATSPRYVLILLAVARLGAVTVALNAEARGAVLAYYVEDSAPQLVIVDPEHAPILSEAVDVSALAVLELEPGTAVPEPVGPSAAPSPVEPSFKDPFVVLYTSGSTGKPKGVEITNAQAVSCGAIFAEHHDLTPDDRLYTCLPFFHINATNYTLCGALVCGGSVAIGPRFSARAFWRDVAALEATQLNVMGSMLKILEKREPEPVEREHKVRTVFTAPLPANTAALAERYGVDFVTTYAQTEWLPSSMTRPGEGYDRPGAAGPVLPYSEVQIVDEDDVALPPGQVGEIVLRAHEPHVTFSGYLGRPEESLEVFRNLRFHTGDRGELDENGWLYFRGRAKDVIRRRGENISAVMVEELVLGHSDVLDVAAVPVPSPLMEDDVFVYVVPRDGAELAAGTLHEFCRETMPRFMVPLYIDVVTDLPRTATNKVAKAELTERACEAVKCKRVQELH